MLWIDFFVALGIGLILSVIFWPLFRTPDRRLAWAAELTEFFWFFLLVFVAAWLGGIWVVPVGPRAWGVNWLPFLATGLLFALLLAVNAPMREMPLRRETLAEAREEWTEDARTFRLLNLFYWVLLISLLLSILLHYRR